MVTVGLLSAVDAVAITTSDSGSTLSLTWEPPFTLDITGVDPDITYCVDVINSTSSVTLHSECGITETEFSYPLPEDAVCHSYVLAITPVNVVGRGVSSSVSYIGTEAGTASKCWTQVDEIVQSQEIKCCCVVQLYVPHQTLAILSC